MATQDGVGELTFRFRLNVENPKERMIVEALLGCGKYGMSRFAKRALFQLATGMDYDTGLPLKQSKPHLQEESAPKMADLSLDRAQAALAALDDGLSDWSSQ